MGRFSIKIVAVGAACALLGACASTYRPVIDTRGVDPAAYERDLEACRAYAAEVDPAGSGIAGAAVGAGAGAVLGAVVGAFFRAPALGAAFGASVGGVEGAGTGAASGVRRQVGIIDRCLAGRGYRVLG
jgi:outer membrane lipoprotein SlyB